MVRVMAETRERIEAALFSADARDHTDLPRLIDEIHNLPPQASREMIHQLGREAGDKILVLLSLITKSRDTDLALVAVETMASIKSLESALALQEIIKTASDKKLRKEAKRSLYRMKMAGVEVEELTEEETPSPERELMPRPRQALVSHIDGAGGRLIWIVMERPLGALSLVALRIADTEGIKECLGVNLGKKRLKQELERIRKMEDLTVVEVPATYGQLLVREAYQRNLKAGIEPPLEYKKWQKAVEEGEISDTSPLIYRELQQEEVRFKAALLLEFVDFLSLPEFSSWFFELDSVATYALELLEARQSKIILSDWARREREARIIGKAVEGLFSGDYPFLFKRRLEEMAYILWKTDRREEAKKALAAALALGEDGDQSLREHPLISAMVLRSLNLAIQTIVAGSSKM
ncbi:hypothetical protein HKBW3S44_00560 [Candidatus Hakubella thermalkaliphila]|uniref:HEAT repeat domain-containing protein n=2 Tax=Candidatus Hakubella thermalkaliphila TaxID=2754717 RepID=A0A6V8PWB7_9ACTN|nr:hypothetical protein [Candidatus Hakubella thermalkaliphila]GFP30232.1 hypothetical protein HKBW3S34_01153 [Candidatus Hakubella thermalkaliphila]GFP36879.1 hypothetical protein HKBW3S44_00560 [Candidatus Hakubella thermalkaliphila]GFP42573.1 hypothetical protein HKBW3C_01697 [Candidatus Hakubella thermalkaliphila]